MKQKTRTLEPAEDRTFILIDGTEVTSSDLAKAGMVHRKVLLTVAFVLLGIGILIFIQLIVDLATGRSLWIGLLVIEILLVALAVALLVFGRRWDSERLGLTILNLQHRNIRYQAQEALIYNEIEADVILELHVQKGNLFYIDTVNKRWQFRRADRLSKEFGKKDLAKIEALNQGVSFESAPSYEGGAGPAEDGFSIRVTFADAEHSSVEIACKTEAVALQCAKELIALYK